MTVLSEDSPLEQNFPPDENPESSIEDDPFLAGLLSTIDEAKTEDITVRSEHRRIRLECPTGILVDYHQDMWEKCPDLVNQIVEDVLCGLRRGVNYLKRRVDERIARYGEPVGLPGHMQWDDSLKILIDRPKQEE